jgi:hypothetical protein
MKDFNGHLNASTEARLAGEQNVHEVSRINRAMPF